MSINNHESLQFAFSPQDFDNKIDLIINNLKEKGMILIKNVFSSTDARDIATRLGSIIGNIDADNSGITEISNKRVGNNKKNSIAFTTQRLNLHTDRSPLETPPNLIMNWICVKNCTGGQAILVDGYKIFEEIKLKHKDILNILMNPEIACFTDGIDTFTGPIFYTDSSNKLSVRFRYDQCSFFKLEAKKSIVLFQKIAEKLAHIIDFNIGSGYIINNNRWLHGRSHFEGSRMIRRIHIMGEL